MPHLTTEAWREAHKLITAHGDDATIEAAMRADQALEEGDVEAFHKWGADGKGDQ